MTLYSTMEREAGKLFTGLNTYLTINLSIGLRLIDGVPELIGISNDEKEGIEIREIRAESRHPIGKLLLALGLKNLGAARIIARIAKK